VHEAKLYSIKNSVLRCHLCWNLCEISEGEYGFCNIRVNKNGKLYTLTYGNISAMESRPIEIKPFYHFKPSSTSMTFSSYSCNLQCPWCQNWHFSRKPPPEVYNPVNPDEVIAAALKSGDLSVCASFNEPTLLFEYLLDLFRLAKQNGLLCTMVSNGYMTPKALKMLAEAGLDAINIDIKGDSEICGADDKVVWNNVRYALKLGIHVEVVNLIVTAVNDGADSVDRVIQKHLRYAGEEVPVHFTRYFPAFLYDKEATDIKILETAVKMARTSGIEYAYIGNVPGSKYENTFCPQCHELLIKRTGYRVIKNLIKNEECFNCGKKIYGVF